MSDNNEITVWHPTTDLVGALAEISSPEEIVGYAQPTLSPRDQKSIVAGFNSGSYEMVATFVWAKAAATLKKQLATLGMEFVGEMLCRNDLFDNSDPSTSISDYEALSLAEDLGMVTPTQAMRLNQSLVLVTHFANIEYTGDSSEEMVKEEAIVLLKNCITSILGKPKFETAIRFVEFRKSLAERSFNSSDAQVQSLIDSPYFFIRTTVSILLSLVKTEKGAPLEHAVGNTILIIPSVWQKLKTSEKWQIGQAYAEVNAAGNRPATIGLKKALTAVHGFDYVPESLRSNTFNEAASRVLMAHFGINNFYNEVAPMSNLASLGTTIPKPAFARCMEATLAVWLGNAYGESWGAIEHATALLGKLRTEQWEYYINECFPRDRVVLSKLSSDRKPTIRWTELVKAFELTKINCTDKRVQFLINNSKQMPASYVIINRVASDLRAAVMS
ncbi:hypothetical protein OJF2_01790 [Aquisphaera giovannonii]|uniref:Uncharacterized protein n=1 Tax=Aquisphaera giovannonii TaxID=406548 RepID=A0A5B9VUF2_9BACT|nr:hypothetical protein [Aquisphaera giovannonii]QEH31714.1 hypothetical protein OJF2_01790 [Aquisphaera giovannonii]